MCILNQAKLWKDLLAVLCAVVGDNININRLNGECQQLFNVVTFGEFGAPCVALKFLK